MDPNTALLRIRALASSILKDGGEMDKTDLLEYSTQLAEHIEGLDTWLCQMGFLPDDWQRGPGNPL